MRKPTPGSWIGLKSGLFYTLTAILFLALIFPSCTTPKNTYYFKNLPYDTLISSASKRVESMIRKNDLLSISISSLNPAEDLVYNAASVSSSGSTSVSPVNGYLVDASGNIQLHKLGTINVEGMTRRELKDRIQTSLQPYLKDAVVTVRYMNHRITVLGEVGQPRVVPMPEERLSLLEVLSSTGDATPFGRKDNILIIRETQAGKQLKRLNLEDHSIFSSEWYYLQPDDVVYIEPNDKRIEDEKRSNRLQTIGIVLSGVSVGIIILDRVLRN